MRPFALLLAGLLVLGLAACSGPAPRGPAPDRQQDAAPSRPPDLSGVPDAVPRAEARSRYGNPASYEVFGQTYHVMDSADGHVERGVASWYGTKFHGRRTSSGEPYDMYAMTAAHTRLPLPTYVQVTNLDNGRSVVVKVNDRGPFARNRIIDMSYAAAHRLGMVEQGTARVEVRAIDPGAQVTRMARPEPLPAPVSGGGNVTGGGTVYVQVGAFSSRYNAEQMLSQLRAQDLGQAVIHETAGRQVFRVRIGPLASVELADQTARDLQRLGYGDYRIVVD
ncbi:MAG TPA: septal ring lytic transglycosylase RlpA family protein [Thioalkalivibrio sp.]|nr:septal ring lytic transglycosylase RlpA family protein [Thioalkalivibrio sp.]